MYVKHLPRECKIGGSKVGIMLPCSTLEIHLIEKLVARVCSVYFPFFQIQDVISTRDWMVANNSKCLLSRHRHFVYLREEWAIKRNYLYNSSHFIHNCLPKEIFFYITYAKHHLSLDNIETRSYLRCQLISRINFLPLRRLT